MSILKDSVYTAGRPRAITLPLAAHGGGGLTTLLLTWRELACLEGVGAKSRTLAVNLPQLSPFHVIGFPREEGLHMGHPRKACIWFTHLGPAIYIAL